MDPDTVDQVSLWAFEAITLRGRRMGKDPFSLVCLHYNVSVVVAAAALFAAGVAS